MDANIGSVFIGKENSLFLWFSCNFGGGTTSKGVGGDGARMMNILSGAGSRHIV